MVDMCVNCAKRVCKGSMNQPTPFRSNEIAALLRAQTADSSLSEGELQEGSAAVSSSCEVAFALFLEPHDDQDPNWSVAEWLADVAIRKFSPSPVLMHTELIVPPIPHSSGGRTHFATYLGRGGADWQNINQLHDGIAFYLIENGWRWRAIPIFGADAAMAVRNAAERNLHAPYSVSMYLTSAPPLRVFSNLLSDAPGHAGHCATITSRVLKQAGVGTELKHASPYYSPSSLYNDLNSALARQLTPNERRSLTSVAPEACQRTIETLLRAPLSFETVAGLGDAACIDAVRHLTLCACEAAGDSVKARNAQKQLASALLRWCLLRKEKK